jgi:hypothetical protein
MTDGPQRALTYLRARREGRVPRSVADLELPLMLVLAGLLGIAVVVWLNGQGAPDSGEIRRVTERPQLYSPREALAAGKAERAAAARAQARARRARAARRLARRRAALAAAAARRPSTDRTQAQSGYQDGNQYGDQYNYPAEGNYSPPSGQTYTQQRVEPAPAPAPKPAPKPQPKRSSGGGGGSGQFDDSG